MLQGAFRVLNFLQGSGPKAAEVLRIALSGLVERNNETLLERPWLAGNAPYGAGWLIAVQPGDRPSGARSRQRSCGPLCGQDAS